ncbi:MAG: 30S ribosomal protein S15 [Candidatus Muiribacteriota bacterium]
MSIKPEEKRNICQEYRVHEKDTGSSEVQIAILTRRIENLRPHFKEHNKDHHSKRGLINLVKKRQKLLNYLNKKDRSKYLELVNKLGLRK